MSAVKWCDIGDHAYPGNQPGATTIKFEQQVKNQWGGYQPNDVVQDVCAACAKDVGVKDIRTYQEKPEDLDRIAQEQRQRSGGRIMSRVKALTNGDTPTPAQAREKGYDPEYVAWLEAKTSEPLPE